MGKWSCLVLDAQISDFHGTKFLKGQEGTEEAGGETHVFFQPL
jgi:hypothetical protein